MKQNSGTSFKSQHAEGGATPTIIGVDFWVAHAAKFDFVNRVIELEVNDKMVKVPFKVGDEDVDEEVQAVYCNKLSSGGVL